MWRGRLNGGRRNALRVKRARSPSGFELFGVRLKRPCGGA